MKTFRDFFTRNGGRAAAVGIVAVCAVAIGFTLRGTFGPTDAQRLSTDRLFICSRTGKTFFHTIRRGDEIPIQSPHSGEKTGYLAELCFWNADGSVRAEGFPVLLNVYVNNPEPTFCPDCGRLVVGHNPAPAPDRKPALTRQEYRARHKNKNHPESARD